jgi:predicted hydrolase (HD superfamily)
MHEYVKNENLKHMYAVSGPPVCQKYGEDEDKWSAVGILHDFDWEFIPCKHPVSELIQEQGDDEIRRVLSMLQYGSLWKNIVFLMSFRFYCAPCSSRQKLEM